MFKINSQKKYEMGFKLFSFFCSWRVEVLPRTKTIQKIIFQLIMLLLTDSIFPSQKSRQIIQK